LLVSCGLPPDLLPPYKTLPPSVRGDLMAAWEAACAALEWQAVQPPKDVVARKRQSRAAGAGSGTL
jgi:hypothetical protein